jgi:hypothetical protein
MQPSKIFFALGAMASALILLSVMDSGNPRLMPRENGSPDKVLGEVKIGGVSVTAEIVSTAMARERGLSGRMALADNTGMLFVFPRDDRWGFWMKGMNFPIDIIWLDTAGKIITIAPSVSPQTYPQVFYPQTPARYVLELPAGFTTTHELHPSTQTTLP